MRNQFTRDFYIHKGAVKIADRQSDAVAYVYERNGVLFAQMFFGKQAKPAWHYRFTDASKREKRIVESFAARQSSMAFRADRKAKRNAETHNFEVGHILKSSWGYEQTNVDFYQVTKIISDKMIEIREIGSMSGEAHTSMSGTVLPVIDAFKGDPMRKRADRGGVKIASYAWARIWEGKPVFTSSWH